jgi:hypothetical protein
MEDHGFDALGGAPADRRFCSEGDHDFRLQQRRYLYRSHCSNNVGTVSCLNSNFCITIQICNIQTRLCRHQLPGTLQSTYYVPYLSPIHPGRVLTTFLAADGICEALIASGASRMANANLISSRRAVGGSSVQRNWQQWTRKRKKKKVRKAEKGGFMFAKAFKFGNARNREVVGLPSQQPSGDSLEV